MESFIDYDAEIDAIVEQSSRLNVFKLSAAQLQRRSKVYQLFATIPKKKFERENYSLNEHNLYFEELIADAIHKLPDYAESKVSRIEVKGQNVYLAFRTTELRDKIFQNGLVIENIGNLRFRTEKKRSFRITVMGVPLIVSDGELKELYARYGEVISCYSVKKFTRKGLPYYNGNRVVVFASVSLPIPKNLQIGSDLISNKFTWKGIPAEIIKTDLVKAYVAGRAFVEEYAFNAENQEEILKTFMRKFFDVGLKQLAAQESNPPENTLWSDEPLDWEIYQPNENETQEQQRERLCREMMLKNIEIREEGVFQPEKERNKQPSASKTQPEKEDIAVTKKPQVVKQRKTSGLEKENQEIASHKCHNDEPLNAASPQGISSDAKNPETGSKSADSSEISKPVVTDSANPDCSRDLFSSPSDTPNNENENENETEPMDSEEIPCAQPNQNVSVVTCSQRLYDENKLPLVMSESDQSSEEENLVATQKKAKSEKTKPFKTQMAESPHNRKRKTAKPNVPNPTDATKEIMENQSKYDAIFKKKARNFRIQTDENLHSLAQKINADPNISNLGPIEWHYLAQDVDQYFDFLACLLNQKSTPISEMTNIPDPLARAITRNHSLSKAQQQHNVRVFLSGCRTSARMIEQSQPRNTKEHRITLQKIWNYFHETLKGEL